jgi:A/G-specific adenine glycosylase
MDYGAWIKRTTANPGRRSRHHVKQTPFAGSRREARAAILKTLLSAAPSGMSVAEIRATAPPLSDRTDAEIGAILEELAGESFLARLAERYRVA